MHWTIGHKIRISSVFALKTVVKTVVKNIFSLCLCTEWLTYHIQSQHPQSGSSWCCPAQGGHTPWCGSRCLCIKDRRAKCPRSLHQKRSQSDAVGDKRTGMSQEKMKNLHGRWIVLTYSFCIIIDTSNLHSNGVTSNEKSLNATIRNRLEIWPYLMSHSSYAYQTMEQFCHHLWIIPSN